jgi:5-methylcytosine-specific restriction endonuclease McrA
MPRYRLKKSPDMIRLVRAICWAKTGGFCFYCWRPVLFLYFVCDHRVPLARGGVDDHSNLVPACVPCDTRKRYHLPTANVTRWLRQQKVRDEI